VPVAVIQEHPGRFKCGIKDMDKVNPDWNAEIEADL
jgi:hypothetical protein